MGDSSDKIQGMQDEDETSTQGMKVDAQARMEQMRYENSQHSANEE
jgi:hypothetical protein